MNQVPPVGPAGGAAAVSYQLPAASWLRLVVPGHYYLRLPHGVLVRLLRFRLGCHHLRVTTGRWHHLQLPRSQRHCQRYTLYVIDDEAHCLLPAPKPR